MRRRGGTVRGLAWAALGLLLAAPSALAGGLHLPGYPGDIRDGLLDNDAPLVPPPPGPMVPMEPPTPIIMDIIPVGPPPPVVTPLLRTADDAGLVPDVDPVGTSLAREADLMERHGLHPPYMPYGESISTGDKLPDWVIGLLWRVEPTVAGGGPSLLPSAPSISIGERALAAPPSDLSQAVGGGWALLRETCDGPACAPDVAELPPAQGPDGLGHDAASETGVLHSTSRPLADHRIVAGWVGPAAASGVAAAALLPLWMLYRRLSREHALRNPMRAAVLERVRSEPGATAGGLARFLGVEYRTVAHHLDILQEFGFVETRRIGAWVRFYESGAHAPADKVARVALNSAKARKVLEARAASPTASLAAIARTTGLPKSTARWHLARLARFGVTWKSDAPPAAAPAAAGSPSAPA
jgi:DNA-binding transcriptional ArsR family regulator